MNPVYVCLFAFFAVGLSIPYPFEHRKHHPKPKANITDHRFVVSISRQIYGNDSVLIGSGAVLNSHWIITSANQLYYAYPYVVRAGSDDAGKGGKVFNVSKVIVHEKYSGNSSYNVALLRTVQRISFDRRTGPVSLSKYAPLAGRNYTVVGFSGDSRNTSVNSTGSGLHVATAYIDSPQRNQTANGTDTYFYARTVGSKVYNGDLLVQNGKLFGYYIGGNSSARYNQSEVYANVAVLRQWVQTKIRQHSKFYERIWDWL